MASQNEQISDSVVRKIQLLLNLGQRREGNENEAAAAMAKAQELLAQYNLDLATVQDKVVAGGTAEREAESRRDYAKGGRSALYQWQRNLVKTIAEANFCCYWHVKEMCGTPLRLRNRHQVLGRVANTTAVLVMVDYLFETIERLLPSEYATLGRRSQEASLWREGCAERLAERISAKAEAMRRADYATQGEAAYTTAIQVADLSQKEDVANYDFRYGAGAWARRAAREAEYEAGREERTKQWELAEQKNEEARLAAIAAETDAQRRQREAREAAEQRRNERYWDSQWRQGRAKDARKETTAYASGRKTAEKIGLDGQLGRGKDTGRIG